MEPTQVLDSQPDENEEEGGSSSVVAELRMTQDSRVFKLKVGRTQIGRDVSQARGNQIVLLHKSISSVHAVIEIEESTLKAFITDLGSTNGTYLGNNAEKYHKNAKLCARERFPVEHEVYICFGDQIGQFVRLQNEASTEQIGTPPLVETQPLDAPESPEAEVKGKEEAERGNAKKLNVYASSPGLSFNSNIHSSSINIIDSGKKNRRKSMSSMEDDALSPEELDSDNSIFKPLGKKLFQDPSKKEENGAQAGGGPREAGATLDATQLYEREEEPATLRYETQQPSSPVTIPAAPGASLAATQHYAASLPPTQLHDESVVDATLEDAETQDDDKLPPTKSTESRLFTEPTQHYNAEGDMDVENDGKKGAEESAPPNAERRLSTEPTQVFEHEPSALSTQQSLATQPYEPSNDDFKSPPRSYPGDEKVLPSGSEGAVHNQHHPMDATQHYEPTGEDGDDPMAHAIPKPTSIGGPQPAPQQPSMEPTLEATQDFSGNQSKEPKESMEPTVAYVPAAAAQTPNVTLPKSAPPGTVKQTVFLSGRSASEASNVSRQDSNAATKSEANEGGEPDDGNDVVPGTPDSDSVPESPTFDFKFPTQPGDSNQDDEVRLEKDRNDGDSARPEEAAASAKPVGKKPEGKKPENQAETVKPTPSTGPAAEEPPTDDDEGENVVDKTPDEAPEETGEKPKLPDDTDPVGSEKDGSVIAAKDDPPPSRRKSLRSSSSRSTRSSRSSRSSRRLQKNSDDQPKPAAEDVGVEGEGTKHEKMAEASKPAIDKEKDAQPQPAKTSKASERQMEAENKETDGKEKEEAPTAPSRRTSGRRSTRTSSKKQPAAKNRGATPKAKMPKTKTSTPSSRKKESQGKRLTQQDTDVQPAAGSSVPMKRKSRSSGSAKKSSSIASSVKQFTSEVSLDDSSSIETPRSKAAPAARKLRSSIRKNKNEEGLQTSKWRDPPGAQLILLGSEETAKTSPDLSTSSRRRQTRSTEKQEDKETHRPAPQKRKRSRKPEPSTDNEQNDADHDDRVGHQGKLLTGPGKKKQQRREQRQQPRRSSRSKPPPKASMDMGEAHSLRGEKADEKDGADANEDGEENEPEKDENKDQANSLGESQKKKQKTTDATRRTRSKAVSKRTAKRTPTPKLKIKGPHRFLVTGINAESLKIVSKVEALGGELTSDVFNCTHLMSDTVRRTTKFLSGLSRCQHAVHYKYVLESFKKKTWLDEDDYMLKDTEKEKKFNFSLAESLRRVRSGEKILEGKKIFQTSSVKPNHEDMKSIVECAGGEMLPKRPAPKTFDEDTLIISCPEDTKKPQVKKLRNEGFVIYSNELLLTGVLRQKLETDQFILDGEGASAASAKSTAKRKRPSPARKASPRRRRKTRK